MALQLDEVLVKVSRLNQILEINVEHYKDAEGMYCQMVADQLCSNSRHSLQVIR